MSIQAVVKYWYTQNGGFGHVSIEVSDLDSDKKHYISWAMTNDEQIDRNKHQINPIEIELPPIETTFEEFENQYKNSHYFFLDSEELELYSEINKSIEETDAISDELKGRITGDFRNKVNHYGDEYDFMSENCAHAVEDILYFAGYTEQLPHRWGLRPYTVAHETCNTGIKKCESEKAKLLKDGNLGNEEKIKKLVEITIQQLEIKKSKQLASHFPSSAVIKTIEDDITLLNSFLQEGIDFSELKKQINSTKTILELSSSLTNKISHKGLRSCIELIPYDVLYIANIELQLDKLENKAENLRNREAAASDAAISLVNQIHIKKSNFEEGNLDEDSFQRESMKLINNARATLKVKRGYEKLLFNLGRAILGVIKITAKNFSFFTNTNSKKCPDKLEKRIFPTDIDEEQRKNNFEHDNILWNFRQSFGNR
ncbi:hypothetical protein E3983_02990 [Legionella israelensis]|uniref:DUF4105 domain-containing protein n=1 Tax=Legionella israelensis TaxID=454 RepID=A0AAX1EE73_9GAMM|nr:hypothetical protein [Legionella israelensis]QBR83421.1 hypothetical protein E3983_02990 [Legionella israelensis]